jgi:lipopolysaccharide transport system ATP-binding protein
MVLPIIEVEGVSKRYRLGEFSARTIREEFEQFLRRLRRAPGMGKDSPAREKGTDFWALTDVSFDVRPGEVLGIIGRNGAGKSTLLKILSRITEPTSGRIRLRGRVASLLEVGTGFHPELTGRENVYLNGTILGMTKAEVTAKFDEIVAFAEVERFLDTPVKRYSSGMYVRLGFAVAAHLEPEILVVDEVLAVGDVEFQKKCLGKIQNVSVNEGRTVLFVSHNMTAVTTLCSRAILLSAGRIDKVGAVKEVTDHYLSRGEAAGEIRTRLWNDVESAPGDDRVRIRRIEVLRDEGDPLSQITMDSPFRVVVDYWSLVDGGNLIVELILRARDGSPVFHSMSTENHMEAGHPDQQGLFRTTCHVPGHLLNEGNFLAEIYFMHGSMSRFCGLADAATFVVYDRRPRVGLPYYGRFFANVHPLLKWDTMLLAEVERARVSIDR